MVNLKVTSFNVKGLRQEFERRKIFNYLHENDFDIIMLQETHSTKDIEKFWTAEWGGKIYYSHGESNSKGVAIMLNRNLNTNVNNVNADEDGRQISIEISLENIVIACTCIYAPNIDDDQFFVDAFAQTEQMSGRRIISGDFNTVLDKTKDIKGGKGYSHTKATQYINQYIEQNDLLDIWRIQHPDEFRSTFIQKSGTRASALMERLDYILIDSSLHQFVKNSKIAPAFMSDHAHPVIELQCSASPPGPGFWKLNTSLLEDEKFICDVVDRLTNVLGDQTLGIFERWELMKFSVKQAAIIRGSEIVKSNKNKLKVLKKKLEDVTIERDK